MRDPLVELGADLERLVSATNGHASATPGTTPSSALADARVDLLDLIDRGLPEREFVPGTLFLIKGKRYLVPACAGAGKSIAFETVAVDIAIAGGTVAII